jgi:pyridoxine 5'-phosphate synthase PdxJ
MSNVTISLEEYESLKRLTHYFRREGGLDGGSEVDRLKTIIHELDRHKTQVTLERNAVWAAITEAEEHGKDYVLISDIRKHELRQKERYNKAFNGPK